MTEQVAVTLASVTIGFVAGVCLCIGSAVNSAKSIETQATPYWDFSEPLARALVAQRAQYVVGGLLLAVSFALQVWAVLASPTSSAALPLWLGTWPRLVLAVLAATSTGAYLAYAALNRLLLRQVLEQHRKRKAQAT